jgi:hypothetical protein
MQIIKKMKYNIQIKIIGFLSKTGITSPSILPVSKLISTSQTNPNLLPSDILITSLCFRSAVRFTIPQPFHSHNRLTASI